MKYVKYLHGPIRLSMVYNNKDGLFGVERICWFHEVLNLFNKYNDECSDGMSSISSGLMVLVCAIFIMCWIQLKDMRANMFVVDLFHSVYCLSVEHELQKALIIYDIIYLSVMKEDIHCLLKPPFLGHACLDVLVNTT